MSIPHAVVAAAALLFSLAADAQPAAKRPRVAVLEVKPLGIAPEKAQLLSEVALTEAASVAGVEVIGRSDIQSMIGFEKEKQMLGCADDSSCMTEIAGALGVDWILVGSLGQLDALYRLDLKLIDARRSKISGRVGESIEGSQARLVAATQAGVRKLIEPIAAAAAGAAPPAAATQAPPEPPREGEGPAAGASFLSRLVVGLRLAVAGPGGDVDGEYGGMGQLVSRATSIGGDVAVRIGSRLAVGLYADGGPVVGKCETLPSGCDATLLRGGLQLLWQQPLARGHRWWASAGTGYEKVKVTLDAGDASLAGPEYLRLSGGADFAAAERVGAGLYVTLSAGEYRSATRDFSTALAASDLFPDGEVQRKKLHFWIGLGLRGTYGG